MPASPLNAPAAPMTPRKYAEIAAASLAKMLKPGTDSGHVADIVETVLADATREQQEGERLHLAETEAAADARLKRLLEASSARTSRAYSATTRPSISAIRISGASTSIRKTFPASRRKSASSSRPASRRSNIASAVRTDPIAGSTTSSISFAMRRASRLRSSAHGATSARARRPRRRRTAPRPGSRRCSRARRR